VQIKCVSFSRWEDFQWIIEGFLVGYYDFMVFFVFILELYLTNQIIFR